jgi:hypothetical protein
VRLGLPESGSISEAIVDGIRTHPIRTAVMTVATVFVTPAVTAYLLSGGVRAVLITLGVTASVLLLAVGVLALFSMRDYFHRQRTNVKTLRSQIESLKSEIEFTKHSMREQYKLDRAMQAMSNRRAAGRLEEQLTLAAHEIARLTTENRRLTELLRR